MKRPAVRGLRTRPALGESRLPVLHPTRQHRLTALPARALLSAVLGTALTGVLGCSAMEDLFARPHHREPGRSDRATSRATAPDEQAREQPVAQVQEQVEQYLETFPKETRPGEIAPSPASPARTAGSREPVKPPATASPSASEFQAGPPQANRAVSAEPRQPASAPPPPPPVVKAVHVEPLSALPISRRDQAVAPVERPRTNTAMGTTSDEPAGALLTQARALEAHVASHPSDLDAQYRLRLLYLLAGNEGQALQSPGGVSEENAALLTDLFAVLLHGRQVLVSPAVYAEQALSAAERYVQRLRALSPFRIEHVALCRRVDSYGVYDPLPDEPFPAGQPAAMVVYCQIRNFTTEKTADGQYRTVLSLRLELLDKDGHKQWDSVDPEIEDLCRMPRTDFFIARVVRLPATLPPGEYRLRVEVTDRVSGEFDSTAVPLQIQ